jgi:hypothetical protein
MYLRSRPNHHPSPFLIVTQRIEADVNYKPNITCEQLLDLVYENAVQSRHNPSRLAYALRPFHIDGMTVEGKLYQFLIAGRIAEDADDIPSWRVDDYTIIHVSLSGLCTIHRKQNVDRNNFTSPISGLHIEHYLNRPNQHRAEPEEKESKQQTFITSRRM